MVLPAVDECRARQVANRWLAEHVGDMLMADQAVLEQRGNRLVWRLGAYVTALSHEPFGPVGYVEMDAGTGQVLTDENAAKEIAQRGEHLERAPSDRVIA